MRFSPKGSRIDAWFKFDNSAENPDNPLSPPQLGVEARYLFGAKAADLPIEGELRLTTRTTLEAFPGYRFGRHDEPVGTQTSFLEGGKTDADGTATLPLPVPRAALAGSWEADPDEPALWRADDGLAVRVLAGAGRVRPGPDGAELLVSPGPPDPSPARAAPEPFRATPNRPRRQEPAG